jgi:hypothetical protein
VATLNALADRLRAELGDTGRSFVENFTGDGSTTRFQLTQSPINGSTAVIKVNGADVSSTTTVEEGVGILTLAVAPTNNAVIQVSGTAYRYFTDTEICYYVNTAFTEHAQRTTDSNGSLATLSTLPAIDEYPLVILATAMALYTLATDAAFDIDIISPDGVSIPRSERYRQLMEMVQAKKEQYKDLCSILGLGMYRIETFTLRRISRTTNNYVPIYRPKEVDDGSIPQRVWLSLPTYGDVTPKSPVTIRDISIYAGDDFMEKVKFGMDITTYTPLAQIRLYPDIPGSQVGPVILASFTFTKEASTNGGPVDILKLILPGSVTRDLPNVSYYDLQLTAPDGSTKTYLTGKVFAKPQVSIPLGPM